MCALAHGQRAHGTELCGVGAVLVVAFRRLAVQLGRFLVVSCRMVVASSGTRGRLHGTAFLG